jgi:succinoglycan biosynthesis protein ExoA
MELPIVSVVMPVRNEANYIQRSVDAVLAQNYPGDRIEVIVADGMSTDGTRDLVDRYRTGPISVRLIDNPGRIVPGGLNAAIAAARGDIIVRVDGHCEIAPDYLRRCVDYLRRDGVDGVGGPVVTVGETPLAEVIATAMSSSFGVGNSRFRTTRTKTMLVDTVPFAAYTRAAIDRTGPYDEEMVRNQDDEYNFRLRKMGGKVLLAADIRSRYYSRSSFRSLWSQFFQYGYWKVRVMQKHPYQMRVRHFVPPAFTAALLMLVAISAFSRGGALLLIGAVGAYLLALGGMSLWVGQQRGPRFAIQVGVAFAILHLAYGSGFLVGLARFWKRWSDPDDPKGDRVRTVKAGATS